MIYLFLSPLLLPLFSSWIYGVRLRDFLTFNLYLKKVNKPYETISEVRERRKEFYSYCKRVRQMKNMKIYIPQPPPDLRTEEEKEQDKRDALFFSHKNLNYRHDGSEPVIDPVPYQG